jgi:hypothetical protein
MKIQRSQPLKLQQQQQTLQEINESGLVETVRQPYHFQTNSKGFGNINLSVDEAGDIFLRME